MCLENRILFLIGSPETVWTSSALTLTFEWVNLESFMRCSPNERRFLLNSLPTLKQSGYTRMLAGAEEAGFTWPLISEDVKEFLTDCGCSLAKKNRWKKIK